MVRGCMGGDMRNGGRLAALTLTCAARWCTCKRACPLPLAKHVPFTTCLALAYYRTT